MITIADWDEIIKERNLVEFVDYNRIMRYEILLILYSAKERLADEIRKRLRRVRNEG